MSKFGDQMRGLTVFISDIRNCKSREAEKKRINKELANIRSKFKGDKLDGYQKKKYVCKLIFIFLLGNNIEFGHQEAVNLLASLKFSEKQIGYLFVSVLIAESHELIPLIVQAIRNDLESRNPVYTTLAMQCIANVANKSMTTELGKEVPKILVSSDATNGVKQTAALCLLKLVRNDPNCFSHKEYGSRISQLLNDRHLGVLTAVCSLVEELARIDQDSYKSALGYAIVRLSRVVSATHADLQDYTYYFVPAPWLSVKLMRLMQCFEISDGSLIRGLVESLDSILSRAQEPHKSKKVQHANAKNAVLFEAINLIVHLQSETNLQIRSCIYLGAFLTAKETNLRYLALESMSLLATSELSHDAVKKHQDTVLSALKTERDVSVRQRAIDLLYAMCDRSNATTIVGELLNYLEKADYAIREELVLKIAILAEKFAVDYTWYVDTILSLIRLAGDYVSEEVWYRVVQIVINREDVQGYAAKTCFEALQAQACHENMVKVGGYILGEFGNLIAGDSRSSPLVQFQLLHSRFHLCSASTRGLLLSTYVKFINLFPEIKAQIQEVLRLDSNVRNSDAEIQQRALEYLQLSSVTSSEVLATVLEEMPPFPERESSLLAKLRKTAPKAAKIHEKALPPVDTIQEAPTTSPAQEPLPASIIEPPKETSPIFNQVNNLAPISQPAPSDASLLVDVLGGNDISPQPLTGGSSESFDVDPEVNEGLKRFYTKNSGVLYENDVIQIGVKSEYKETLGRIGVFYGNKTNFPLVNFNAVIKLEGSLTKSFKLQPKPISSTIDAGAQAQQLVNIECLAPFSSEPTIAITFTYNGAPKKLGLKLPIFITKFLQGTSMNSQDFFKRWKQLGSEPSQEVQKIFSGRFPCNPEAIKDTIKSVGMEIMEGIDPNPDNYVGGAILSTSTVLVGCLLRLEPNKQTEMFRLTVRSSDPTVSKQLVEMLSSQF